MFLISFLLSFVLHGFAFICRKLGITLLAQRFLLRVLSSGPVPQHVAFVMDGNRRFARMHGKQVPEGHGEGYLALKRVLEICLRLRIRCVSVYAFAIDNFKRSPEEVDALMNLAQSKLLELCEHGELLDQYGVKLNVVGRTELFPDFVQAAVKRAEDLTKNNLESILNICMPYASRDEITTAVEDCVQEALSRHSTTGTDDGTNVLPMDITEDMITSHLMSMQRGSPPLDILVRTSGVTRLSDYMLWQCCEHTQLHFSPAYWPDFGLFDFVPIILQWQRAVWFGRKQATVPSTYGNRTTHSSRGRSVERKVVGRRVEVESY
ncbi:dehydrodolichyl diphosphate synthetase [Dendrothele bispora CBS 962.96]|uniref:Alkyl transferase n=1 Tax=Dendrothele bispora (strain CBS 962.96) TaxID=1314807 RepID=A0A4S8M2L8_DENBC|nr:dehydrodolichyl diphosphate synthetase [Dendrothele bispora CBS 962.96]